MKKYAKWIGAVALIAIVITVFLISRGPGNNANAQSSETVEAFIGDLDATATATGQLEAAAKAGLSFVQSGTVAERLVDVGDAVNAGDPLLVLDTTALERAVRDAEQAVLIQQSRLLDLQRPATEVEIAAANANVANAQARLDDLLAGGSGSDIAAQEAVVQGAQADVAAAAARLASAGAGGTSDELLAAEFALEQAQTAYTQAEEAHRATFDCTWNDGSGSFDCVGGSDAEKAARVVAQQALADLRAAEERLDNLQPGSGRASVAAAQAALISAQASLSADLARLEQLRDGPTTAELASAEAAVARANQQLNSLLDGPADNSLIQQEVQVEQAAIALQRAQNNLEAATLLAPFDGVVTAVMASVGETATGVVVELVNMNTLEVVLEVDEIDLGSLDLGQNAVVTFETYPGTPIAAEVVQIAPENTPNQSGTVVYEVNLALAEHDLFLLEGMTADASLTTDQRENVLLVPNEAIQSDRSTGTFTVDVVTGRADEELTVESTPVTIGLRDGSFTQITGGIEAGTELAVGYNPPPTQGFGPPNN